MASSSAIDGIGPCGLFMMTFLGPPGLGPMEVVGSVTVELVPPNCCFRVTVLGTCAG
jgi:hypothetical protein